MRHLNNGTDHRHSKSCCDQSSPARRTIKATCFKLYSVKSALISWKRLPELKATWHTFYIPFKYPLVNPSSGNEAFVAKIHYIDVIMGAMASQNTSLTIVYSTVYSDADQRKHQSSASLAFLRGIHRWPVNSPHKWPVTSVENVSISWRHHVVNVLLSVTGLGSPGGNLNVEFCIFGLNQQIPLYHLTQFTWTCFIHTRAPLQWRHNERGGVSNHQPHDCFLNRLFGHRWDHRKHQSSASLAFVRGIHLWPVNSPHKGPVTWKRFPFDDVIMHIYAPSRKYSNSV